LNYTRARYILAASRKPRISTGPDEPACRVCPACAGCGKIGAANTPPRAICKSASTVHPRKSRRLSARAICSSAWIWPGGAWRSKSMAVSYRAARIADTASTRMTKWRSSTRLAEDEADGCFIGQPAGERRQPRALSHKMRWLDFERSTGSAVKKFVPPGNATGKPWPVSVPGTVYRNFAECRINARELASSAQMEF